MADKRDGSEADKKDGSEADKKDGSEADKKDKEDNKVRLLSQVFDANCRALR